MQSSTQYCELQQKGYFKVGHDSIMGYNTQNKKYFIIV